MNDNCKNIRNMALTKGSKAAAIYLIIAGGLGILFLFAGLGQHYPEFQAKSFANRLGSYTREMTINFLFIVSGIGILSRKNWARKIALIILAVSTVYSANSFSWGYSHGPPSSAIRLVSIIILCLWNGLWFYLIYKVKPTLKEVINRK